MQNKRRKLQPIDAGELLSDIYNNDFPPELFHHIVSYISAYPYYVTLSRVSKQWRKELEEEIIPNITQLDLMSRHSVPKFHGTMHIGPSNEMKYVDRPRLRSVAERFMNVTELTIQNDQIDPWYFDFTAFRRLTRVIVEGSPYKSTKHNYLPRDIDLNVFSFKHVKFVNMYIPRVEFCDMKSLEIVNCIYSQGAISHLGPILKSATRQKSDKKSVFTELLRLKRNGFHMNYVYKDDHKNSFQAALHRTDMPVLRFLWEELKHQVRSGKEVTLAIPSINQIFGIGPRAVNCIRAMSEKDVPTRLLTDWNKPLECNNLTPLGYAYVLKRPDLVAILKKLGAAVISPGSSNPVYCLIEQDKTSLEQNIVFADYVKDLLLEYPELQISGDEDGRNVDKQTTFRPHFAIRKATQLPTLMMLHGIGVPLDEKRNNEPLIAALWGAGVEIVQYILDNTPPDPSSCEKALKKMFEARYFERPIIQHGEEWVRNLRIEKKTILHYAISNAYSNFHCIAFACKDCKCDPNETQGVDVSPMEYAISFSSRYEVLIEHGGNIHATNFTGITLLERVVDNICHTRYKSDILEMLSSWGINCNNTVFSKGRNIWHFLMQYPVHHKIKQLDQLCISPDENGITPLMIALKTYNTTMALPISSYASHPVSTKDTKTVACYALREGIGHLSDWVSYLSVDDFSQDSDGTLLRQFIKRTTTGSEFRALIERVQKTLPKTTVKVYLNKKLLDENGSASKSIQELAIEVDNVAILNILQKRKDVAKGDNLFEVAAKHKSYDAMLHLASRSKKIRRSHSQLLLEAIRWYATARATVTQKAIVDIIDTIDMVKSIIKVPEKDGDATDKTSFINHCSTFQLLCAKGNQSIISAILHRIKKAELMEMAMKPEPTFDNNFFHFLCIGDNVTKLMTKSKQKRTRSCFCDAMFRSKFIRESGILNKVNKHGDTPSCL